MSIGNSLSAGDIELDEKFTLITGKDSVAVSVTQPMKEIEPEVDEDDLFLDEDGEPIEGEEEKEGAKPAEESGGGDAPADKEAGAE